MISYRCGISLFGGRTMKSGRIIIFFAELKERREGLKSNEGRLEWFRMDELLDNMPQMPFTAYYVVKHYLERGKDTKARN